MVIFYFSNWKMSFLIVRFYFFSWKMNFVEIFIGSFFIWKESCILVAYFILLNLYTMGSYTKINHFRFYILNNAEYLSFMNTVLNLLPSPPADVPEELSVDESIAKNGSPAIGLSKEFVNMMNQDLEDLMDIVKESRIAQETEEIQLHKANWDKLVIYITTRITKSKSLPLEVERDAGKYLYNIIKPYIGLTRLPAGQGSAQVQGLLVDLRKEENMPYVTTLGLEAYLDELESENNAYMDVMNLRTKNRAANKKENSAILRARIDSYYEDLVLLAQSYNIVQPTTESQTFVRDLNQLINETMIAYNQRGKRKRTSRSESSN